MGGCVRSWEAWGHPTRVSVPQQHHQESSWRGSQPRSGGSRRDEKPKAPGRPIPIFRECARLQGGVSTPLRPSSPSAGPGLTGGAPERKTRHPQDKARGPGSGASSRPGRQEVGARGSRQRLFLLPLPSLPPSQWSVSLSLPSPLLPAPVPFPAAPSWCLLVPISNSSCLPPPPRLCKGPENTQRELCCQTKSIRSRDRPAQLFPIPSALAGVRHRAGSPPTPPFGEVGGKTCWPQGPQAAEWVARDQSPPRGTTTGQQLALKTEESLSAEPGPQSPERRARGYEQGCTVKARRGAQTHTSGPHSCPHVDAGPCSLCHTTHVHTLPCAHAHTRARAHTHTLTHTHAVCAHLEGI